MSLLELELELVLELELGLVSGLVFGLGLDFNIIMTGLGSGRNRLSYHHKIID
jgi:hypothetical protein